MKSSRTTKTKRKTPKRGGSIRHAVALPDDACPTCGTMMRDDQGTLTVPINGDAIAVPDVPHLRCPKCNEVVLRLEDTRYLDTQALEIYRTRYHLLSAAEIRALRERLNLSPEALAGLLRIATRTIERWEAGRNVQTASLDVLLRLLRDVPGSLEYLRRSAA